MTSSEVKQMQEHLRRLSDDELAVLQAQISDEELEMLIDTVKVKPPLPPPPPPARKIHGEPSKNLKKDVEKLSEVWGVRMR